MENIENLVSTQKEQVEGNIDKLNEIYENKKDKTLIIISHRNNTVKYCDSIYVMEDGKIIDNGTFEQIMKKHSYLKEDVVN